MKKFLSIFAFTTMLVLATFTPHAFANVNIGINEVFLDPANQQIVLNTTVENTIDQARAAKEISSQQPENFRWRQKFSLGRQRDF